MHDPGHPLYLPLRLLHILGAMIFLGALVVALWWKLGADRSGDAGFAARTHRRLRQMDGQIVGPAALVTFAAGYAMVRFLGGRIAQHAFVLFGLIWLFSALGLWYLGMRNLGDKLATEAESADASRQPLSMDYAKRSAAWVACAAGAIFFVVLAAVFMVFRIPGG
ncbi:MAG TPA: DUF2269 family protein [Candidatus Thermoplasmatota archaeon]|nr:DUF2269 family protein [Candidatus Thermoplasmatota archaeon]